MIWLHMLTWSTLASSVACWHLRSCYQDSNGQRAKETNPQVRWKGRARPGLGLSRKKELSTYHPAYLFVSGSLICTSQYNFSLGTIGSRGTSCPTVLSLKPGKSPRDSNPGVRSSWGVEYELGKLAGALVGPSGTVHLASCSLA
jgi:hypothetical protein